MFYKCRVNLNIQLHARVCMREIEEVLFYNTERKKKSLEKKKERRKQSGCSVLVQNQFEENILEKKSVFLIVPRPGL